MKYIKLFEEHINEIGDAGAKSFKYRGPNSRQILAKLDKEYNNSRPGTEWSKQKPLYWQFSTENADYVVKADYSVNAFIRVGGSGKPDTDLRSRQLNANLGFDIKADKRGARDRVTNFGEQYRVLATVCDIFVDFVNAVADEYVLNNVYMIPKAESGEAAAADNKRGRFYEAYIKKQIKRIKRKVTVKKTTIKTNSGNEVGGFVLKDGHSYSIGGFDGEIRND